MSRTPRLPRGRRVGLVCFVGLVVLALAVLAVVAAVQIKMGHERTVLGNVSWVSERLRTRDWTDVGVLVAGIVCGVLGLLFLVAGLLPARRPLLQLSDPAPHTISGIARRSLTRDLTAVAASVDGVSSARVKVKRSRVSVRAKSALRDRSGLREAVTTEVEQRLAALSPRRPLSVSTRVLAGGS